MTKDVVEPTIVEMLKLEDHPDAHQSVMSNGKGMRYYMNMDHINEAYMIGFKENSITLVKDMMKIIDLMLEEYPIVSWSCDSTAPVKKIYDRLYKSKKWDMYTTNPNCDYFGKAYTQYAIKGKGL